MSLYQMRQVRSSKGKTSRVYRWQHPKEWKLVIPHLPGRLVAPAIPIGPLVFSIIPHVTGGTLASVEPKIERAVCDRHRDLGSHDPQFVGLPAAIEGHKADQRGRSLHNGDQRSQLAESVATRGKNLGTGEYRTYPEMINGYRCTDRDVLNGNPTATREVVSCQVRSSCTRAKAPRKVCNVTCSDMLCAAARSYLESSLS
jgi:hypothetical protein